MSGPIADSLADQIRSEAAIADRPGQMGRLEAIAARVAAVEAERDRLAAGVRALAEEWDPPGNTYEHEGVEYHIEGHRSWCGQRLRSLLGAAETTGDQP